MKNLLTLLVGIFVSLISFAQAIITVQPSDQSVCIDTCASFEISAVGTGMNYFWEVDQGSGYMSAGTNSDNFSLCDSISGYDSAMVRCIITDINGDSAISMGAMISVDSCLPPVADFDFYFDYTDVIACYTSTSQRAETLIWLFGDGNTSASNDADTCHDYATKELYWVKLYAYNAHGSDSITKKVDILDINDPETSFSMFPNPVNDVMMIQGNEYIESISIYNLLGRMEEQVVINANSAQIDLSSLSAGTYFVRIQSADQVVGRKVIKL